MKIILASKSGVRKKILEDFKIDSDVVVSNVDEDEVKTSLQAEGANPLLNDNPQEYLDKRLEKAKINFIDFEYNQHMIFNERTNDVVFKESFCDSVTKNIRQNERSMKMDNIDEIIKVCKRCGFIVKGQYGFLNDKWQFIYILEKQL